MNLVSKSGEGTRLMSDPKRSEYMANLASFLSKTPLSTTFKEDKMDEEYVKEEVIINTDDLDCTTWPLISLENERPLLTNFAAARISARRQSKPRNCEIAGAIDKISDVLESSRISNVSDGSQAELLTRDNASAIVSRRTGLYVCVVGGLLLAVSLCIFFLVAYFSFVIKKR
jgi:hypothetical protein